MKLIAIFAIISIAVGLRARRIDRWIVALVAALFLLNILYAFVGF